MSRLIYEEDLENAILEKLGSNELDYDVIVCDPNPSKQNDLNDGTFRTDKKQCVLPNVLFASLRKLNPNIKQDELDKCFNNLTKDFSGANIVEINYQNYKLIRDGMVITTRKDGESDFDIIKIVDFENPENNAFTAVSQMWIKGHYGWRRPDILIFINGLPMVFIELKDSSEKVKIAYDKNLVDYKKTIPNLFAFNQICVLSNALETRLGSITAGYEDFFEWLRKDEKESIDRNIIHESGTSIEYFIYGLLIKKNLIDYIENFIIFRNQNIKIIAKNHQYLGVNNLIQSVINRKELNGKLGVFWHTQGAGKSYSMVMFVRKVKRKINGNFTFLVVTDRDDLDNQIHKNFVKTEVISSDEKTQPNNSEQLRQWLTTNMTIIFTLIHKFKYDKGKEYPLLSERDDIIVLVDEAHRTQYKQLAENMRKGLPNANYIAFTGTPLLGSKRLTNQWFGKYVSEYNFKRSVEDGSTVPLFYSRRVPEVGLENNFLDEDFVDIIESENLNDEEQKRLENSESKTLEVIKRENRLKRIAKDIAHHFPRRGFLGKGMVVSVDKYTAVKMYELVQEYWKIEIQDLRLQRNNIHDADERKRIDSIIKYMEETEMSVVISDNGDDEKFIEKNLNIQPHRRNMEYVDSDGNDIEDRFKDPDNNFRLVFVCAMWLTGFDVPSLSTVYLDKPMKSHTLMQAIARANRTFPNKEVGIIIDYVNVFKYMREALRDYAQGDDEEFPIKNIDELLLLLDESISETDNYLKSIGINLNEIASENDTLKQIEMVRDTYNKIIERDETKDRFTVLSNTVANLYEASKPEIIELRWKNTIYPVIDYLHKYLRKTVDDEKIERARKKLANILDSSVFITSDDSFDEGDYYIKEGKVIDLSKIDIDQLKSEIKRTPYKGIEIDDLKEYIENTLESMINQNCERVSFAERYKRIIDKYNSGGSENEDYYEQLVKLVEEMKEESNRASLEGLTEEELEIYDLLVKGKKLSKQDEQKVKLASKNLYNKISENRKNLLIVDWYKDEQPIAKVKSVIQESLDKDLPENYNKELFSSKINLLLDHFIDMSIQGYGWIGAN